MLRVLENNVQLCLSAGLKSGLRGVVCFQVVHTYAATEEWCNWEVANDRVD